MGKPLASRLLGHFDTAELKVITRSAAELRSVPMDILEDLVEEFAGEFSNGAELRGNADRAENLLSGVLPPDQVADIMSDVRGQLEPVDLGEGRGVVGADPHRIPRPPASAGSGADAIEARLGHWPPRSCRRCRATCVTRRRGACSLWHPWPMRRCG